MTAMSEGPGSSEKPPEAGVEFEQSPENLAVLENIRQDWARFHQIVDIPPATREEFVTAKERLQDILQQIGERILNLPDHLKSEVVGELLRENIGEYPFLASIKITNESDGRLRFATFQADGRQPVPLDQMLTLSLQGSLLQAGDSRGTNVLTINHPSDSGQNAISGIIQTSYRSLLDEASCRSDQPTGRAVFNSVAVGVNLPSLQLMRWLYLAVDNMSDYQALQDGLRQYVGETLMHSRDNGSLRNPTSEDNSDLQNMSEADVCKRVASSRGGDSTVVRLGVIESGQPVFFEDHKIS